ncbi:MAG: hypothetical protein ACHQIG_05670 [Acidimicrobiia bacterium]
MDRLNHVKIRTPHPEIVDAFLRQVCEFPDGWPVGTGATELAPDAPLGPGGVLDYAATTAAGSTGTGSGTGGFITGDPNSRQFQIFGSDTPRLWAICIGTRHIERAHERCLARGIPATPITVADWNERDNIRNFFCIVDGLTFEVIRVEPKQAT